MEGLEVFHLVEAQVDVEGFFWAVAVFEVVEVACGAVKFTLFRGHFCLNHPFIFYFDDRSTDDQRGVVDELRHHFGVFNGDLAFEFVV